MFKPKFVDFRALKSQVTMVQVLEHYGLLSQMHRSGDSITGCCPIHGGENDTAFRVSVSKNVWNCFSECQGGGNVLDFVARKESVSILKAANLLIEWFGLSIGSPGADQTDAAHRRTESKSSPNLTTGHSPPVQTQPPGEAEDILQNKPLDFVLKNLQPEHPYLSERGLTPETIQTFGLGFCSKGLHKNRIAIPIHNGSGQVVAYAGRSVSPEEKDKYLFPKGFHKSLELFNLHRALAENGDQPLVIVEGFFDCFRLWEHGLRVVALMGSSLSLKQEELIRVHTNPQGRVLVMLDEDDAGRKGREEIVRRLAPFMFVKVHVFPKEGMQPEHLSADQIQTLFGGGQ